MAISTVLWLACAPALTASFAALVVAACVLHAKTGATAALVASAVLVLLLRFRLADAGARARILSGHSPFGCFAAPKTVEAFVDRLCAVWHATDGRPAVVGSGWGWFIGRARAPNAVFTHNLQGRIGKLAFLAGTELRTVEATLRKQYGRTFWSTPTMQRISIGSWLARSCHGNSGAAGKPTRYAASRVLVVDLASLETTRQGARWEEYGAMKPRFDKEPGRFVDRGRGV